MHPIELLNQGFSKLANTHEGREKMASETGGIILDRLREGSFFQQIIPSVKIKPTDPGVQVSPNHDTLVKIIEIEPQSRAMSLNFRNSPTTQYIRGGRLEAAFYTVSSPIFQKTEQELMAYRYPITRVLEQNMIKDMAEIPDREWVTHMEAAVQYLQKEANGGTVTTLNRTTIAAGTVAEFGVLKGSLARNATVNNAVVRTVLRPDLAQLFKRLDGNRLKTEGMLWTESDWNDVLTWTLEDNGDKIQSETVVEGYKYNTLLGRRVIKTIKTDILRPGIIFSFTAPNFLGEHYLLNETKFYIDKVANLISFQSWMDVCGALVNVASVRKLELCSGDLSENDTDGIRSQFLPKAEDELGAANNRVDAGINFPYISHF
jgi:hypothetical protein